MQISLSVRTEGQVRACRWSLLQVSDKNDTVTTSAVSHCTQNKHFFISCFRCWAKQPRLHARTSARCIMGTIYQSHHALEALNTATVFSVSLLRCYLSLARALSVCLWTAPLLVQLSLSNACKEKWLRLKVTGGTGVLFEWKICPHPTTMHLCSKNKSTPKGLVQKSQTIRRHHRKN